MVFFPSFQLALSDSNRLYTWGSSPTALKLQAVLQKRTRTTSNLNEKGNGGLTRNRSNSVSLLENIEMSSTTMKTEVNSIDRVRKQLRAVVYSLKYL